MSKMNLNELRDKAYKTACEHGFHDQELSNNHFLCLVISELMEAVEADRKGRRANVDRYIRRLLTAAFVKDWILTFPKSAVTKLHITKPLKVQSKKN